MKGGNGASWTVAGPIAAAAAIAAQTIDQPVATCNGSAIAAAAAAKKRKEIAHIDC